MNTTPNMDTSPNSLYRHNAQPRRIAQFESWTQRPLAVGSKNKSRPDGHNAETWTQRRNELLGSTPKLDITPKVLIGRNVENGNNVEIRKWTLRQTWTQHRKSKTEEPEHFVECPQSRHNFWRVYIAD
ncbi:hypothetical protein FQR65_LT15302 [Abscondita terminalis]|nr:hypothetical protein FQR65_LT15302 [Abscondita terminalis]